MCITALKKRIDIINVKDLVITIYNTLTSGAKLQKKKKKKEEKKVTLAFAKDFGHLTRINSRERVREKVL